MYRASLEPEQRTRLHALNRAPATKPTTRERIEIILLSDTGLTPPAIAAHLGRHATTVRKLIRNWADRGETALHAQPPGPAPDVQRREQVETALRELLARERTWTSRQLSQALAEEGLSLSPRQTRKYLTRLKSRYKRTVNTLQHKQKPLEVEKAKRKLEKLKKGHSSGG